MTLILLKMNNDLQRIRKSRGLTQKKLAEESGVNYNTIIKIENGKVDNPRIKTLEMLSKVLMVPIWYLTLNPHHIPQFKVKCEPLKPDKDATIKRITAAIDEMKTVDKELREVSIPCCMEYIPPISIDLGADIADSMEILCFFQGVMQTGLFKRLT